MWAHLDHAWMHVTMDTSYPIFRLRYVTIYSYFGRAYNCHTNSMINRQWNKHRNMCKLSTTGLSVICQGSLVLHRWWGIWWKVGQTRLNSLGLEAGWSWAVWGIPGISTEFTGGYRGVANDWTLLRFGDLDQLCPWKIVLEVNLGFEVVIGADAKLWLMCTKIQWN